MTKCIKNSMFSAQFCIANGTVNHHVVTTDFGTSRINMIFLYRVSRRVTICRDDFGFIVTTASATITSVFAFGRTRRSNSLIPFAHVVTKCIKNSMFSAQFCIANSTVYNHIVATDFGTSRINMIFLYRIGRSMAICRNDLGFIMVTSTAISTIFAFSCTSGSNGLIPFTITVAKCINVAVNIYITALASMS